MSTNRASPHTWRVTSAQDFGRALAGVRSARKINQQQLADTIGVQRSYLAEIEAGASVQMIDRLVRALRRMGAEIIVTLPPDDDGHAG
jgi:transcriptional regulator with XRE-family HTH domain